MCKALVINEAAETPPAIFSVSTRRAVCLPLSRRQTNRGDGGRPQTGSETPYMSLGDMGSARDRQEALRAYI